LAVRGTARHFRGKRFIPAGFPAVSFVNGHLADEVEFDAAFAIYS